MRRDEAASIELDLTVFPNETKLHREPEQPRHPRDVFLVLGSCCHLTIVLKKIGEHRIGVERHVPEHIVEDVGLGEVIELLAFSNPNGGRKFTERQVLKKCFRRDVAVHGDRFPSGRWCETPIDFCELRDRFPF